MFLRKANEVLLGETAWRDGSTGRVKLTKKIALQPFIPGCNTCLPIESKASLFIGSEVEQEYSK